MVATDKRVPWNSETAKIAAAKSVAVKRLNRQLYGTSNGPVNGGKKPEPVQHVNGHCLPIPTVIALMRRALRRYLQWSLASTDANETFCLVQSAVEVFNMEQRLLGRDVLPTKSKSKKPKRTDLSPHDLPMPDPVDCGMAGNPPPDNRTQLTQDASESGNCGVDTSKSFPASGQAVSAPLPQDDTPF
jgi:hypothetical protein